GFLPAAERVAGVGFGSAGGHGADIVGREDSRDARGKVGGVGDFAGDLREDLLECAGEGVDVGGVAGVGVAEALAVGFHGGKAHEGGEEGGAAGGGGRAGVDGVSVVGGREGLEHAGLVVA